MKMFNFMSWFFHPCADSGPAKQKHPKRHGELLRRSRLQKHTGFCSKKGKVFFSTGFQVFFSCTAYSKKHLIFEDTHHTFSHCNVLFNTPRSSFLSHNVLWRATMEEGYVETGISVLRQFLCSIHCTTPGVPLYWLCNAKRGE